MRAVTGSDWTSTDHLIATVVDVLAIANWQRANSGAKHPSAPPKPLPRPGDAKPMPRYPSGDRLKRLRARAGRD